MARPVSRVERWSPSDVQRWLQEQGLSNLIGEYVWLGGEVVTRGIIVARLNSGARMDEIFTKIEAVPLHLHQMRG